MKRKILNCLILLTSSLLTGCIVSHIHIPSRRWKIETKNPTSYVYQVSTDSLVHSIENNFRNSKEKSWKYVSAKQAKFGYDYCVHMYSNSSSILYRTKKGRKGCPYLIELYLCCDSVSPKQTKVTTAVFYSLISSGAKKDDRWHHDAPPSTIEEYQLLRLIGKFVGEHDMPPVRYPKKLPAKELEALQAIY